MSKSPAFQFYTGDWSKDVELHMMSFQSRGIWIEMLICMWDAQERGKLTGTPEQLCRLIGCNRDEIDVAIQELSVTKTANVTVCNDFVTIINRRMYREENERKLTRSRVKKHRDEKEKRICNADVTPPSSSSKRITPYSPPKLGDECNAKMTPQTPDTEPSPLNSPSPSRRGDDYDKSFLAFWEAYPRRVGKGAAWRAWKNAGRNRPTLESILNALALQRASPDWHRDGGKFIPHPATWLNQRRWEDEIEAPKAKNGWK